VADGCQQLATQQPIPVPPAAVCTKQNLSPEALFTEARAGVAVVLHDGSTGSGFVVRHQNGSTLLVTNAHVVEGTDAVTVKWQDGSQDTVAVVSKAGGKSPLSDLALLEVKAVRGKVLNLRPTTPNVGAEVVAIGAPQGLQFSLSRGVVSSLRDNDQILQIDAPINPGNSGNPVIDRTGCVVGVATFKLDDIEGLNFAVAASRIAAFLASPERPAPDPEVNPGPARADKPTCWFQIKAGAEQLQGFNCRISARVNSNGHTVDVVVEPGGLSRTAVLWEGDTAEVILNGQAYQAGWQRDDVGDIQVMVNGGLFILSLPEEQPSAICRRMSQMGDRSPEHVASGIAPRIG
jgi:S1-C subfamily serine protease